MANSYFRKEPFIESEIIVYDGEDQGSGETHYWFVHTLGDILTSCLNSDFSLESFCEYPDNISSDEFDVYEDQEAQLPLSFTLIATKGGWPGAGMRNTLFCKTLLHLQQPKTTPQETIMAKIIRKMRIPAVMSIPPRSRHRNYPTGAR